MADPFGMMQTKESTADQFVPGGTFAVPMRNDWQLENAIVNGYEASGWVYSCATILANHVSSLPWKVWETTPEGDLQIIPNHQIEQLIENPNAHHTRKFQMKFATLHLCLGGNALWKVIKAGGQSAELWPMNPDNAKPIPHRSDWLTAWEITNRSGGRPERVDPSVVVHAQFPDPGNPYWGMPPLRAIGKVVDMDRAQVDANRNLVENDMSPAGVFQDPNIHSEKDRKLVKDVLKKHFSGPLRTREPLVLSAGAKWHQLGISPRELDWIESRKQTVGEICTAYGFLTARFTNDAATYNNLSVAIRYEWENGALPIAGLIGDGLALTLLTLDERRAGLKIRPDTSGVPVLREDIEKAAESFERLVRNGVPRQMAASIVNLPVGELPEGDRAYLPAMLEEIGSDGLTEEDM